MASSGLSVTKSIGLHGHWGFSASFDFIEVWNKITSNQSNNTAATSSNESKPILRFLLVHPGDIRHIICTLSRINRHFPDLETRPQIEIYIIENPIGILARDLLLLELFYDIEVPIRQRANIFLEIYGNLKVQRRTNNYIEQLGERLEKYLSHGTGILENVLDFSMLNYRERDELEKAFKAYDRSKTYDMDNFFDHRKRGLYEDRYDNRKAIYDWDYHSGLKKKASIVHIKQYKHWRDTGIAFEFGDQQYTEPNKTFMTYTEGFLKYGKDKGLKKEVKGFWGDIVSSPYFAFGIDSETPNKFAEGLYEIYNKNTGTEQHRHHAVEVALYNLFSYLWEVGTGKCYKMLKANDIYSGLGSEATIKFKEFLNGEDNLLEENAKQEQGSEVVVEVNENGELEEKKPEVVDVPSTQPNIENDLAKVLEIADCISSSFEKIKIIPLTGSYNNILSKEKFKKQFDGIFVSSRYAQILSEDYFPELLSDEKNVVVVESAKFLIPLNQETKNEFLKKEEEYATKSKLTKIEDPPIVRRRRDEEDKEYDVSFFVK